MIEPKSSVNWPARGMYTKEMTLDVQPGTGFQALCILCPRGTVLAVFYQLWRGLILHFGVLARLGEFRREIVRFFRQNSNIAI
jgi:hypothetical protein